MQEIMEDGSEGKTFVENTVEDLIPHIKKSLSDPNVKYVKVYSGKRIRINTKTVKQREDIQFVAEEQKSSPLDELIEKCEEEDEKEKALRKE